MFQFPDLHCIHPFRLDTLGLSNTFVVFNKPIIKLMVCRTGNVLLQVRGVNLYLLCFLADYYFTK